MSKPKIQQQWEQELQSPPDNALDYIAEKDITKQDRVVQNLVVSLSSIPGLGHDNDMYDAERKITAVVTYFVTGSMQAAADSVGVQASTIRKWKQTAPWWNDAVREVKRAKQEQLDSKLTNLIEKSMSELRDRLMNGDEVITAKGKRYRRKISARDLSAITGMLYDKRCSIRKDPLSEIITKNEEQDTLDKLKKDFEKLSREMNAKVIQGEIVEIKTNQSTEAH